MQGSVLGSKQLKRTLMDNKYEHISGKTRVVEKLVARTFVDEFDEKKAGRVQLNA